MPVHWPVSETWTNTLPGGVIPIKKYATPFLDIAAALRAAGLPIPEKIEGLTIGPKLDDGGFLLLLATDNDFSVTQTGQGEQFDVCLANIASDLQNTTFSQVPIGTSCPERSSLLPTYLYAFRTAPDALDPVPEPGTLLLLASGLVASGVRRRRG